MSHGKRHLARLLPLPLTLLLISQSCRRALDVKVATTALRPPYHITPAAAAFYQEGMKCPTSSTPIMSKKMSSGVRKPHTGQNATLPRMRVSMPQKVIVGMTFGQ